jgi:hypothetical protein
MSYGVEFAAEAEADLAALPPVAASLLLDEIERLATDPVGLSRKSHFPFLPGRQLFSTRCAAEGTTYVFTVLFRYGQDEQALYILQIATQTLGEQDEID